MAKVLKMKVMKGLDGLKQLPPGGVITIGNFDGVHLGHRKLLEVAATLKAKSNARATTVITFEPHPLTVLRPQAVPPRLTPPDLKHKFLAELGVDLLLELAPTRELLNLTAAEFWKLLRDDAKPSHIVEGTTFTFGKDRGGTISTLREWAAAASIELHIVEPVQTILTDMLLVSVSSSITRWLLLNGRVRDAAICSGHAYTLVGMVVKGAQRGRDLGAPTANLQVSEQLIPADGVYAGRCEANGRIYPAAISIGTNPTFGDNPRTIEPHLIGFTGDLYGRTLNLEITDWLRDQEIYPTTEMLVSQIQRDVAETVQRSTNIPQQPVISIA
jgi:riboflavin kinase/FMN adenylyltransferase